MSGPTPELMATAVSPHSAHATSMVRASVICRPMRMSVTPAASFPKRTAPVCTDAPFWRMRGTQRYLIETAIGTLELSPLSRDLSIENP
jgi:hypothetical protein